ncbi:hypothetical protein KOI35_10435 [Actinoplanes bogorensis]|uniref:Carbohydrate kinase PfkB domain-containing protein n=1 Tax=Paractinoplanes bogorensis TaxID=1610840 RepID=A0ABS5YLI5_9ACTN|nr:PfkB family carbohydrate kinase [Actinoplanes bogorensis]MBU2663906.1 hypothetical protein [Actinoplanes bogorensis]
MDIVGIGALNLDLIVDSASVAGVAARWEPGIEHRVDDPAIMSALLDEVRVARPAIAFGGSAFNSINALSRTGSGLRLGYVGVAGRPAAPGFSVLDRLDELGVDRQFVRRDDEHLGGVCVSLLNDGERTLITHAGANRHLTLDGVVPYLTRSRLIHVTSFFDDRSPALLRAVLADVKRLAPAVLVSVDPGHVWSASTDPDVAGILRLADYVLVNRRERDALAHLELDETMLVKRPDGIEIVPGGNVAHEPLPAGEIVDATGAGDVFAAGPLLMLARDPGRLADGVALGLRLARHSLRHPGDTGHDGFAALRSGMLGE